LQVAFPASVLVRAEVIEQCGHFRYWHFSDMWERPVDVRSEG
jgi:hypothetical protein